MIGLLNHTLLSQVVQVVEEVLMVLEDLQVRQDKVLVVEMLEGSSKEEVQEAAQVVQEIMVVEQAVLLAALV
jgi:hypothetical protein